MRLLDIAPLQYLINKGLPQTSIELARTFLGTGERLKHTEQSLNFLMRCKTLKIFPSFILNSISVCDNVLFPCHRPQSVDRLLFQLRLKSLNQHISFKHHLIRQFKSSIIRLKDSLFHSITDQILFQDILCTAENYNADVKLFFKSEHQRKLDWLVTKYCPIQPTRQFRPMESVGDRVTVLDLDPANSVVLSDNERQLLSLGPKFAVKPKIDEKLLHKIQVDVAECAYKLKWNQHIEGNSNQNGEDAESEPEPEPSRRIIPFKSPFVTPPPADDPLIEAELSLLNNFVVNTIKSATLKCNLSRAEVAGLKALWDRSDLRIAISDKCGDFVVTSLDAYKQITLQHITSNPDVYQHVAPTHKVNNCIVEIMRPTPTSYRNQINSTCENIEEQCNTLWREIAQQHQFDKKFSQVFFTHHSSLPTMYTLVKTHKISPDTDLSTLTVQDIKARPIVSCSNSPTEKLAWVISHCIKPLLKHIPCYLANIHAHLERLHSIPREELEGLQFYTADISALYTNISIQYSIDAVIELAEEHWEELDTFGLTLVDLQRIMELVFGKAYFTFDEKLYWQRDGLFMGCSPSPGAAIMAVYRMERNSIYTDVHYLFRLVHTYYCRYVDDNSSIAPHEEAAKQICDAISAQDPRGRIKWEIDFPEENQFVPFLDTEIKIESDGTLVTRYFRKPQNKGIILHSRSHHPESTKSEVLKNFYRTAVEVSSGPEELQHSLNIVDELARGNGYQPRGSGPTNRPNRKRKKKKEGYRAPLKLPYISELVSQKIRSYIKQRKLPIRPIFTPGRTLKDMFCRSRPFDQRKCVLGNPRNCKICPVISNGSCSTKHVVYRVNCEICTESLQFYDGETDRPCHHRFMEHLRAAANPRSYQHNALAKHYALHHQGTTPKLTFTILDQQQNNVRRKISEAIKIHQDSPPLNNRDELVHTMKFVVRS